MTSPSSPKNNNNADWTGDKRPWCQPWTWICAPLTTVSTILRFRTAAQRTTARIVTARMLHRTWWLTQRNTLCELWRACPWPGNTSLQHNPSERFNAPISRDCPQTRLRRDLGTSIWRRVERLPPATSLKYIFVRWPHPTSHMCTTLTTRGYHKDFYEATFMGLWGPQMFFQSISFSYWKQWSNKED